MKKHEPAHVKAVVVISVFLFLFSSILTVPGCATHRKSLEEIPSLQREEIKYPEPEVQLSPGDVLEIRFFYTPELNTEQTIRPDGKISLQFLGEVMAQGKTPAKLREELMKSYSTVMKQLDVAVIVKSFGNRRVYVGGSVNRPGSFPIVDRMTIIEALMNAGGVNLESGNYSTVIIIRYRDGKWFGGKIDVENIFKESGLKGEQVEPIFLKPQDIVYVPETPVMKVNRWLDQHLGTILPEFNLGLTYTPNLGWTYGIQAGYDFSQ